MTAYVQPQAAVEQACAEWRRLGLPDDPTGVAMEVIDRLAEQEGLVDAEGSANDGQIDLAASEWSALARRWFDENPPSGEGELDDLPPSGGGFAPSHVFPGEDVST